MLRLVSDQDDPSDGRRISFPDDFDITSRLFLGLSSKKRENGHEASDPASKETVSETLHDCRGYLMTFTTIRWVSLFGIPSLARVVLDTLSLMQDKGRITLYAFVITENQLHLVADAENLLEEMRDFRSFTSRKIIDALKEGNLFEILKVLGTAIPLGKKGYIDQIWAEGIHSEKIMNVEMLQEKIECIHYEPVRRGYVDDPTDWRYSSARSYAGRDGLIEIAVMPIELHDKGVRF